MRLPRRTLAAAALLALIGCDANPDGPAMPPAPGAPAAGAEAEAPAKKGGPTKPEGSMQLSDQ